MQWIRLVSSGSTGASRLHSGPASAIPRKDLIDSRPRPSSSFSFLRLVLLCIVLWARCKPIAIRPDFSGLTQSEHEHESMASMIVLARIGPCGQLRIRAPSASGPELLAPGGEENIRRLPERSRRVLSILSSRLIPHRTRLSGSPASGQPCCLRYGRESRSPQTTACS